MPKGVEHSSILTIIFLYSRVESLMPKGVEHLNPQSLDVRIGYSVESLMPKGVEHKHNQSSKELAILCRISDAERR